jgi:hypothetical protein
MSTSQTTPTSRLAVDWGAYSDVNYEPKFKRSTINVLVATIAWLISRAGDYTSKITQLLTAIRSRNERRWVANIDTEELSRVVARAEGIIEEFRSSSQFPQLNHQKIEFLPAPKNSICTQTPLFF